MGQTIYAHCTGLNECPRIILSCFRARNSDTWIPLCSVSSVRPIPSLIPSCFPILPKCLNFIDDATPPGRRDPLIAMFPRIPRLRNFGGKFKLVDLKTRACIVMEGSSCNYWIVFRRSQTRREARFWLRCNQCHINQDQLLKAQQFLFEGRGFESCIKLC